MDELTDAVLGYTAEEGGEWIMWPDDLPGPRPNALEKLREMARKQTIGTISYRHEGRELKFHALLYLSGRKWDVINGYR